MVRGDGARRYGGVAALCDWEGEKKRRKSQREAAANGLRGLNTSQKGGENLELSYPGWRGLLAFGGGRGGGDSEKSGGKEKLRFMAHAHEEKKRGNYTPGRCRPGSIRKRQVSAS